MTDEVANLILEHLRRMRGSVERIEADMRDVKQRLGLFANQCASLSNRVDRIDLRLERVEKRLDLLQV